ncbi:unnamed protein product, partial [Sphagnum jensenii]
LKIREVPREHKKEKNIKNKKSTPSWSLYSDPEMKRKKRVATYKVFTVEGKVKQTVRSGCRWLKAKYIEMRYGWW